MQNVFIRYIFSFISNNKDYSRQNMLILHMQSKSKMKYRECIMTVKGKYSLSYNFVLYLPKYFLSRDETI